MMFSTQTTVSMHLRRCCKGFTLIELLVSVTILTLLMVLLIETTNRVSMAWSSGVGRTEKRQNIRAIGDFLAHELRAAILPLDSLTADTRPNLQFILNPKSVSRKYRHADALFWQSPIASDTLQGDLAVVGYFVQWDESENPQNPRARLCRYFANPGSSGHLIYQSRDQWINDSLLEQFANARRSTDASLPDYQGLFAEDVIGFWVRCIDVNGNEIKQETSANGDFDSRVSYTVKPPLQGEGRDVGHVKMNPCLPHAVEFSLAILDTRTADRVTPEIRDLIQTTTSSSKTATEFYDQVLASDGLKRITSGLRTYTSRVRLENFQ